MSVAAKAAGLREGDGLVEDFVTIYKEGESELPLSFQIKVDSHEPSTIGMG